MLEDADVGPPDRSVKARIVCGATIPTCFLVTSGVFSLLETDLGQQLALGRGMRMGYCTKFSVERCGRSLPPKFQRQGTFPCSTSFHAASCTAKAIPAQTEGHCNRRHPTILTHSSITQASVASDLAGFESTAQTGAGLVHIKRLSAEFLQPAHELLTFTYANMYKFGPYRRFISRQIEQYLTERVDSLPKAILLTAAVELPNCNPAKLIGTVELSFHPSTRTQYWTLNPPNRCAYLCNMAVDPSSHRKGVGSALLKAAEQVALLAGEQEVYLHVRLQDQPAARLYAKAGYEVAEKDCWLKTLLGQDRRYLLHKRLISSIHGDAVMAGNAELRPK